MSAIARLRAKVAELEQAKEAEALRLCSAFRKPNEAGPSVDQVHARRTAIERQLAPLRRRLAIMERALETTA